MKIQLLIGLLIFSFFAIQCKNNNQKQKPSKINHFESAMPHGETLTPSELSVDDQKKLAAANGRSAIEIKKNEIDSLLTYSDDQLHIYSFFHVDSAECTLVNHALLELQEEVGDTLLNLIFFSLDPPNKVDAINSAIRQKGVTSDVFFTSDKLDKRWFSQFSENWSGEVPAIYLFNQNDGTQIFYQKSFTKEELEVLIQPFIIQ